jgi:glutamine---fructose-6-phosphate transaminase (isomerizing)
MCGILGLTLAARRADEGDAFASLLTTLFSRSESRGKEASGMAVRANDAIRYIKAPFTASKLTASKLYTRELAPLQRDVSSPFALIAHSRLVTNGYEHENRNNQPVVSGRALAVHNGIIVNHRDLWQQHPHLARHTDLDSELITALVDHYAATGVPLREWMPRLFGQLEGMTTTAIMMADRPLLLLATNNGSLYYAALPDGRGWVFASERNFLESAFERHPQAGFKKDDIRQLLPRTFLCIDLGTQQATAGALDTSSASIPDMAPATMLPIAEVTEPVSSRPVYRNSSMEYAFRPVPKAMEREAGLRLEAVRGLKRCTRCILPETFPFIHFDHKGVCNYCHGHVPLAPKGAASLARLAEAHRATTPEGYDCLVPFSGGRDSSYVLHYLVKELGLRPLAFSYDWGMLTDLGRRNQSRMCGALGVEHILVSADIRRKRAYIRMNVSAWLKRPHLGTVPLFMAGDKQYFRHISRLMSVHGLNLSVMGENMLETTRFKSGFCGIRPRFDGRNTYTLSTADKLRMMLFYGGEFLRNPAFINSSLLDSMDAFGSYYMMHHRSENLYDYLPWDEQLIERTLLEGYGWETDPGTRTTWRIGDGTAAFYNYIYLIVAGFTENDTFRSNQVREGMLTREEALARAEADNVPRWEALQWYFSAIGMDWESAIGQVHRMKTRYAR